MLAHIRPSRVGLPASLGPVTSTSAGSVSGWLTKARQAPRVPLPAGALPLSVWCLAPHRRALPLLPGSYELMRQTTTLLPPSVLPMPQVFAGCCQPLLGRVLPDVISAGLSSDAWTPTPVGPSGARARFFPKRHRPSPRQSEGRLSHIFRRATSLRYDDFGAAVIPLCSGLRLCLPPRSLPPLRTMSVWRPWRLHPSIPWFVTSPRPGYASRPIGQLTAGDFHPIRPAALSAAPLPRRSKLLATFDSLGTPA